MVEKAEGQARKRGFEFPTAFSILFALIVLIAIATWFVPAGRYERAEDAELGREVAVRGSYHAVEANPQGPLDVIVAPVAGFYDGETEKTRAVDVVLFVLFIGGFMGVVGKTGAIDSAIGAVTRKLAGREQWMIPILSGLFAIGGSTFGMAEETLPFVALLVPVMMRAGYDSVLAVAIVLVGSTVGTLASTVNPFAVVIASNAAGVSFAEGLNLRIALLFSVWLVSVIYMMRYAARIKADPSRSLVADRCEEIAAHFASAPGEAANPTARQNIVLAIFVLTFAIMIWGVTSQGWWMMQMTALFLAAAISVAVVAGMGERGFVDTFVDGARDLLGVALVIGLARGVLVVMDDGAITDTILHAGEQAIAGSSSIAFLAALFGIEAAMTFIVPSSSGHAVLTMPILAPLGDFAGVERSLVVTAYLAANGVVSLLTPTSAVLMGSIAIVRVPLERWLRFVAPLALILSVLSVAVLAVGTLL